MTDKVEFHEYANLFPMMSEGEFEGLCRDMARNGYRTENPISMYQGKVLDGRNRFKAASEVGVAPTFSTYDGDDPIGFVVSQNLHRRHLNETQRGIVAAKLANMEEGRPTTAPIGAVSQGDASNLLNVSRRTTQRVKAVMEQAPELVSLMESGEMTANEAIGRIKTAERKEKRAEMAEVGRNTKPNKMASVVTGNFIDIMAGMKNESVDMIFSDPPYDEGAIPLYGELAKQAKRVLKIGGSVLVYAGHYALPEIFPLMTPHLRYWWTISLHYATGPYPRLMGKNVFVQWKPMLWFVKEKRTNTEFVADSIDVPAPDKIAQDWQQGEVDYYINKICPLDGIVLDPMCGSGTTLIASAKVGRKSIGIEIDPERANVARGRIERELK